MALTRVTWALVGFHKNKIVDVYHRYGRVFFKPYILKILDGLIISSDTWHSLNIQFKYVAIVDLTLIKISLFLFTRSNATCTTYSKSLHIIYCHMVYRDMLIDFNTISIHTWSKKTQS
jgi:hypothetical protein